ncbi:MAG TPA: FAD-dependent monooxygenase [Vicinamibacteria bacterium]|nr:FAD-dependent monooxygenase [Vicinamibacteria bacterium]
MTATADVVIVGAGPTGLTLAAQLQQFGARVRIVDRQLDRAHESRALAMQPRTLEVLRGLGIAQTLVERGNDAVQLRIHFGQRVVGMRLFDIGLEDTAYPFLLFISQAATEKILNEHLAARGVDVERGVELLEFTPCTDEVTCTLRRKEGMTEQVRTRYLVGCDGAHSTVRQLAGIPFAGGAYSQTFVLADLEVEGELEPHAGHAFLGAQGILLFFPLGTPATWRMQGIRPTLTGADGGKPETEDVPLQELQAICDGFTGGTLFLRDPVWTTYFRLQRRQAARYRAGRVFLAGDAAHVHSPAGAQGMNTGIQDAWNLGWKLALVVRGVADEALLDSYEPERLPVGRFVLRLSDRASRVAISDSRPIRLLRTQLAPRLVPLLLRFGRGRRFGFRTIAQLAINYRDSPAVQEGPRAPRSGPRAGYRLPDLPIHRDSRESWLHEALASPTFDLLLCGDTADWPADQLTAIQERCTDLVAVHRLTRDAAPGALHDPSGEALRRLGAQQAAHYLVRPDGHIAYRNGGTDTLDAERYLARWLPALGKPSPTDPVEEQRNRRSDKAIPGI